MTYPILLALASFAADTSGGSLCLSAAFDPPKPVPSAIEEHRALRAALGEPMPQASDMVMLYGKGGHLSTTEYSIILVRSADGAWRGTAVGRNQIWIKNAPYEPIERFEWILDEATKRRLVGAISRRCARSLKPAAKPANPPPPPLNSVSARIDIVRSGQPATTAYVGKEEASLEALILPPQ